MATYTGDTIGIPSIARRRMEDDWDLPRTLFGGTAAMRAAGERYLPQNESEKDRLGAYQARVKRARLFPGYKRSVMDLAAMPFQSEPTIVGFDALPAETQKLQANADRAGTSAAAFFRTIHEDSINRGMGLFLVDQVPLPAEGIPRDEADRIDARPYFVRIHPDNLVGKIVEMEHGRAVVTDLRVREWATTIGADGAEKQVERIRHWTTTTVETWEMQDLTLPTMNANEARSAANSAARGFVLVEPPRPHGFPYGIPVVIHYTERVAPGEAKPPLMDLAWENVAHWQAQSGDTEALRFGRYPILVGTAVSNDTVESKTLITAGATVKDPAQSTWQYVEPSGASFEASKADLAMIRENMAWMGMQPLVQAAGPETATGEIRADVREKSLAQQWAEGLEWAAYNGFLMAVQWLGKTLPEDFSYALFRDFAIYLPSASQDIALLQKDVQEGRLTRQTYLLELKRRRKLNPDWDPEQEEKELADADEQQNEARMNAMAQQLKDEQARAAGGAPADGNGGGQPPKQEAP